MYKYEALFHMALKYAMPSRNGHCVFPRTEDPGSNMAEFLHYITIFFATQALVKTYRSCTGILCLNGPTE
jgi:hypothetical protein